MRIRSLRRRPVRTPQTLEVEPPNVAVAEPQQKHTPTFSIEVTYNCTAKPLGSLSIALKGLGDLADYRSFTYESTDKMSVFCIAQVGPNKFDVNLYDYTDEGSPLIQQLLSCFEASDREVIITTLAALATEHLKQYRSEPQAIYYPTHTATLKLSPDMPKLEQRLRSLFDGLQPRSALIWAVES